MSSRKAKTIGMVLAGGKGTRLYPLTWKRTKPAVPFAGKYRIIDFALNNMINSGIYGMYVLTQFKAQSLTEHIQRHWRFGGFLSDYFITLAPAQMYLYEELGAEWYRGTADAIYQNLHLIANNDADYVAIFSGDHIYKMDISHMLDYHIEKGADVTIAAYPTPVAEATRFGVLQVDDGFQITEFQEKPDDPKPIPGRQTHALASMGNYIFTTEALFDLLNRDAANEESDHDFGNDVLPMALKDGHRLMAYDFARSPIPGQEGPNEYWRDVGTIDSYWEASMDLVDVEPDFDLFNYKWPLRGSAEFSAPAKFVHEGGDRTGQAFNSLMSGSVIISGGTCRRSVLSRRVRVNSFATVDSSVLFDDVTVGRNAVVRNAIVDKNVVIPEGMEIGVDREQDEANGLTVLDSGIVAVPKSHRFPGQED